MLSGLGWLLIASVALVVGALIYPGNQAALTAIGGFGIGIVLSTIAIDRLYR